MALLSDVCPRCGLNGGYHSLICQNNPENKPMTTVTTLEELMKYADENFETRYALEPKKLKTNFYVFDMVQQEGRDVTAQVIDRLKHEFDLLKAMGAKVLVFRAPPELVTDGNRIRISAQFNAHDGQSNVLRTGYEYIEGSEIVPEKPQPAPAPVAVAGYDLVEDKEDAILLCARIIHATVEALNKAHNEQTLTWEQSRDSVIAGIKRHLANPNETPEDNHNAWMEYRTIEGWSYGPTKDADAKTHPCMLPYSALGPFQQSKDAIFTAIVDTFFGL